MSVLITGGSGTIGTALAKLLLARGEPRVCILSRGEAAQARMREAMPQEALRFFVGDVRDQQRLRRAMQGCNTVYHCAALKRIEVGAYNPIEMVRTNVDGSVNVIEAAMDAGVARVVHCSTDKAHEPVSPYGYSKALADTLFLAANEYTPGTRFEIVRLGNVAGSTGSVIPTWRAAIAAGRPVMITDPDCTRFWMSPKDAAQALIDSESPVELPAYMLADLYEAMREATLEWAQSVYDITGLRPFEKQHEILRPGYSSADARRMSVAELKAALCAL